MKTRHNTLTLIAILCLPWIMVTGTSVLTAINDIIHDYPDIPVSTIYLISTLTFLTTIISALAAGALAGKYGSYKKWIIVSGISVVITGVLPCFIKNFYLILVVRGLNGVAVGSLNPIINAVIFNSYEGETRTKVLGYNSVSLYISSVVYVMLCGLLCAISWRYSFLIHFVAILPIAFVWKYLPDIKPHDSTEQENGLKSRLAKAFPFRSIFYIILTALVFVVGYPMSLNISVILSEANLGGSIISGVVLSCSTIGGALAGLIFNRIYGKFRTYALPLGILFNGVGIFLVWISSSLPVIILGTLLSGVGGSWFGLATISNVGTFLPNSEIVLFSGVNMAIGSVGSFFSGNYLDLLTKLGFTTAKDPLIVSYIAFGILVVLSLISEFIFNKKKTMPVS